MSVTFDLLTHFTTKMLSEILKKSDKFVHVHVMKTCWESRCLAPLGNEWSTFCLGCFTHVERTLWFPINMRLGGPQSWTGRFIEERIILALSGIKILM